MTDFEQPMTPEHEFAREFLRKCFHEGSLDLGDIETLEGFLRIFSGDLDALIALDQLSWDLSDDQRNRLLKIAGPTKEVLQQFQTWQDRNGLSKPLRPRGR